MQVVSNILNKQRCQITPTPNNKQTERDRTELKTKKATADLQQQQQQQQQQQLDRIEISANLQELTRDEILGLADTISAVIVLVAFCSF